MIDYDEGTIASLLALPFRLKGSVGVRACLFAIPAALLAMLLANSDEIFAQLDPAIGEALRDSLGLANQAQISVLWASSTAVLVTLLAFRTNRAMARFWEGTGLLHQMRGEWFDSVSCCVTFSRAAQRTKPEKVMEFRHTIVRLMSLCHGYALEEISFCADVDTLETIDTMGLDDETLEHLRQCKEVHNFNRVEVCLHLIQSLIISNLDEGVLLVAPPILSRVYQTLSRGFVNLLNAKKIADTRFPFPYAQTIAVLLLVNMVLTPVLMSCLVESTLWAPIFTFMPIFGMFSVNFIGSELENPFGDDDNDLPLSHFQTEMNKCLMMLLQEKADLRPGVSSERCIHNFQNLRSSLGPASGGDDDALQKEDHEDEPGPLMRMDSAASGRLTLSGMADLERDDAQQPEGEDGLPEVCELSDVSEGEEQPPEVDVDQLAEHLPATGSKTASWLEGPPLNVVCVTVPPADLPASPVEEGQRVCSPCARARGPRLGAPTRAPGPGSRRAPDLPVSPPWSQQSPARQTSPSLPDSDVEWESRLPRLGQALAELQKLLDDELLLSLGRSAGALELFCDVLAAATEALPRTLGSTPRSPISRGKSCQEPEGSSHLCHGSPRLDGRRTAGTSAPGSAGEPGSAGARPRSSTGSAGSGERWDVAQACEGELGPAAVISALPRRPPSPSKAKFTELLL